MLRCLMLHRCNETCQEHARALDHQIYVLRLGKQQYKLCSKVTYIGLVRQIKWDWIDEVWCHFDCPACRADAE